VDSLIKQFSRTSQLSGGNAGYIEDLYEQFLADPASVPPPGAATSRLPAAARPATCRIRR
jgi:2-oxoglutarate dehydrogenase complex dehydrogenase (E1) component-like enzyme